MAPSIRTTPSGGLAVDTLGPGDGDGAAAAADIVMQQQPLSPPNNQPPTSHSVSRNSLHMVPLPPSAASPSNLSSSSSSSLHSATVGNPPLHHPVPLRGAPEGSNAPPPLANPPLPT